MKAISTPGSGQRAIASVLFGVPSACLLVFFWTISYPFQRGWLLTVAGLILALPFVYFMAVWRRGFGWIFSRQALRFHGVVAATLTSLLVLFYAEESWRGRRVWAALEREANARGESLDFASLRPPDVPDDQNFAKAPGVAELLTPGNHRPGGNLDPFYHGKEDQWPLASWALQQHTDLAAWQKFFRSHAGKVIPEERRPYVLTFPMPPAPQAPADDVLTALGKLETSLAALRAAAERPVMRWPLDYAKGWLLMEDLGNPVESLSRAAHLLSLRASSELVKESVQAGLDDVLLAIRLEELMKQGPLDQVQQHRRAMLQFILQPVWEGLATHRWNAVQLAVLQKQLADVDMIGSYRQGARGQTLAMMSSCDQALAFVEGGSSETGRRLVSSQNDDRCWEWMVKQFYPVGWFYQDKTLAFRFYQQYADPWKAVEIRNQTPAQRWAETRRFLADPMMGPGLLGVLRRTFEKSSLESLVLQAFLEQAATACALERFRLDQGQFPATLDALLSRYLDHVPADILAPAPAPLKYLQTPDGGFKLYSVGLNRVDDGGKFNRPADARHNLLEALSEGDSDLVWFQLGRQ